MAEQANVEAVVLARLVERPDHLRDAARLLRLPRLALFPLREPRAVGHQQREVPEALTGIVDRHGARDFVAAVRADEHLQRHRRPGRTSVVSSHTRSSVAVRGVSDEAIVRSSPSISTGS